MVGIKDRVEAARELIERAFIEWKFRRMQKSKRIWQAAKIGGGSVTLGYMTEKRAINTFKKLYPNSPLVYVDRECGVIVHGEPVQGSL